jgi:hypothetical protein
MTLRQIDELAFEEIKVPVTCLPTLDEAGTLTGWISFLVDQKQGRKRAGKIAVLWQPFVPALSKFFKEAESIELRMRDALRRKGLEPVQVELRNECVLVNVPSWDGVNAIITELVMPSFKP